MRLSFLFSSALLISACGAAGPTQTPTAVEVPARTASTVETVNQGWLTVDVVGSGPDVVLLPGLASSADVWDGTVAALSNRYTLHVAQVAGFAGAETGEARDGVVAGLADDLATYAAMLEAPVLVGHSMGGFAALHVARDHPERVDGVVVVDSLPFYPLVFDPNATVDAVRPQAEAMTNRMRQMPKEAYDAGQSQSAALFAKSPDDRARIADWGRTSDRNVVADALLDIMTTDLRPDLPDIDVPVIVLYAHDPAMGVPVERADALYRNAYADLPNAELRRIDGSFHFIMDDQPDAFLDALEAALAR
ncbi:MAG: alpha/beta hydrolase [Litorimonas sp.]